MAKIKSYTDLEQSKKLAEILPIESADMHYIIMGDDEDPQSMVGLGEYIGILPTIPCWSLAALFDVLPTINDEFEPQLHRRLDKYCCTYEGKEDSSGLWRVADNPIDACYEMILKLYEFNLL